MGYELRDGVFCWTGESSLTASQILAPQDTSQDYTALAEAMDFLKERLLRGPVQAAAVLQEAGDYGISAVTLKRAKGQMKIVTRRQNEHGRTRGAGRFVWDLLPPGDP